METNISRAYEVLMTKIAVAKQWAANRAKELGSYLEEWQSRDMEEACPCSGGSGRISEQRGSEGIWNLSTGVQGTLKVTLMK